MAANETSPVPTIDVNRFKLEKASSVLEQVSKKLDKNLNVQFTFAFIAFLFAIDPEILKNSIKFTGVDIFLEIPSLALRNPWLVGLIYF